MYLTNIMIIVASAAPYVAAQTVLKRAYYKTAFIWRIIREISVIFGTAVKVLLL